MTKGTTPTIRYNFSLVNTSDISVAYMTIEQDGQTLIEKDLTTATVGDGYIEWMLSQTETLSLGIGNVRIQCRYKLTSGRAYASAITEASCLGILKGGEI